MKTFFITLIIATLAGCAVGIKTTTVQIDDRVFEIRTIGYYDGGGGNSAPVANIMLSTAAKKSLALGCEYFVATENTSQSFKTPQSQVTEGLSRLSSGQVIYKTASGQIYTVKRPDLRVNVFVCFNKKPDALLPGLVFNAKYVANSFPN